MTEVSAPSRWTKLQNEAAVELRIIIPLVSSLGYEPEDIEPKYPVVFQEGRRGRKNEADFVLFAGPLHNRDTSLIVIEAKGPGDAVNEAARAQAESYAFATRAPVVLICGDQELEVWQVNSSFESRCALAIKVDEIEERHGELEQLLRKEAVVDYCRNVALKPLAEASIDFANYEIAELRRTIDVADQIERRLKMQAAGDDLSTEEFLDQCAAGGIVTAPSGYGKSTLSLMLMRKAIARRWQDAATPLAAHVSLPDVGPSEHLLDYVRERVAAHKPGFTEAALKERVRNEGFLLFCDGFDRLSGPIRELRAVEFRNLVRDHPKLKLFVFSRPAVLPEIQLPRFDLQPFNHREIHEVFNRRLNETEAWVLSSMPSTLYELCMNPLLLALTIDVWREKKTYPRRIEELFATWLERTLALPAHQVVQKALRQEALEIIADCSEGGRIGINDALQALRRAQLQTEILDDLTSSGALFEDGLGVVRFEHEALGDYFRALRLANLDREVLLPRLHDIALQPGSFFPVLLMALLQDPEPHAILWSRLSGLDFDLYLQVLRYRADLSPANPTPADGERFLAEMLDGLELPLDGFFPTMRSLVERLLTGCNEGLSLLGEAGPGFVAYRFERAQSNARVRNRRPDGRSGATYVNLGPSGLRLDSGRLLGLRILRDKLIEAFEKRLLRGGPIWRRERLLGWLFGLSKSYDLELSEDSSLADWAEWAAPFAGKIAVINTRQPVPIDDLLADLRAIQEGGTAQLDRGARPRDWVFLDGEALVHALEDHFNVKQLVYRELVESNFERLSGEIGKYLHLPVRWKIYLQQGPRGSVIEHRWSPVEDWSEAGADVIESEPPEPDYEGHYAEVSRRLAELGRSRQHNRVEMGWTLVRSMAGPNGESSAVTGALGDLMKDLEALFEAMPSGDEPPHWG